jgi:hypothetical protein
MAIRTFNSVGGFSVGENPANIILANGDITTANITLTGNIAANNVLTDHIRYANGEPYQTSAGGSNTQIQFNNDSSFAGSANLTFNKDTNTLTLTNGNIVAGGIKTDNYYYANGVALDMQQPAGSNTQIQFNNAGDFGASANLVFNSTTNTLTLTNGAANISNVNVSGNLTSPNIINGTTNIRLIESGNIALTVGGTSNVVVVTTTGANVTGTLNVSGNANVGNLGATNVVATLLTGTLTTAAQPNITSVGTLSSLSVTGNIGAGNVNAGNLLTANYLTGTLTTAAQPNITSVGTLSSLSVTANITAGNVNAGNLLTANYVAGTLTTAAQPNITSVGTLTSLSVTGNLSAGNIIGPLANGNSNVNIPAANGNVNVSVAGNANVLVVTGVGANVSGTLGVTGNVSANNMSTSNNLQVGKDLTVTGNLTVGGSTTYINVTNTSIVDPLIDLGGSANGGNATSYDAKDRGLILRNYYSNGSGTFNQGFIWKTANLEFQAISNVTSITGEVVVGDLGNIRLNTLIGNVEASTVTTPKVLNGTSNVSLVNNGNVTVSVGGTANVAVFSTTGANISGTLGVSGNLTAGNVSTTAVSATGNVSGGNLTTGGVVTATGNVSGGNLTTGGSVVATGNVSGGNLTTGGSVVATGNVQGNNAIFTNDVKIGNTHINWATANTTSTTPANQTIATISAAGIRGVEFFVRGEESLGGKYYIATVSAVHNGSSVDYAVYGTVALGGSTGALAVNYSAGNITLDVTPASSNNTVWVVQYRTI